jgi:transcriptional regulator with XRE-family HTH domain
MSSENSISKIGENIKRIRKEKGISQDRLSKRADLALNTIVNIELGESPNPTIETLQKIANALEVSIEKLLK